MQLHIDSIAGTLDVTDLNRSEHCDRSQQPLRHPPSIARSLREGIWITAPHFSLQNIATG